MIVGVDPDSELHGVAVYENGKLIDLKMMETYDLATYIRDVGGVASIENVMANQFVYRRNQKSSRAMQDKIALHIGRCQQAQLELVRLLIKFDCPHVLYKPMRGNWSKNKAQFEKATGWTGRSNADTRSAAFFGFLALRDQGEG